MTPRELFKVTVLSQVADRGLPIEQVRLMLKDAVARLEKKAAWELPSIPLSQTFANVAKPFAGLSANALGAAAILGPPAIGTLGGYMVAKAREDDTGVPAAQADEKILLYKQLAQDARRRALAKGLPVPHHQNQV